MPDLADYLRDLHRQGIQMIAYVTARSRGTRAASAGLHGNHPVPGTAAQLGPVAEAGQAAEGRQRKAYEEMAARAIRRPWCASSTTATWRWSRCWQRPGEQYRDAADRSGAQGEPVPELGRRQTAGYDFAKARRLGLCQKDPPRQHRPGAACLHLPRPP